MKKFFRKLTGSVADTGKSDEPRNSKRESAQKGLADLQAEMKTYKGQVYNPAEDDCITTESLFSVIDGDTGQAIDVRELLGVTEEEFKASPELQAALAHMNKIKPIDEAPQVVEEHKKDDGVMTQKARHFQYFNILDTLPVKGEGGTAGGTGAVMEKEHVVEMNVEGASANVIAWDNWWQLKEEINQQLFQAIGDQKTDQIEKLCDETVAANEGQMLADINAKDESGQTPLHSSMFTGNVNIAKLLLEKYAEINARDQAGQTPLHLACMLGNLAMVRLLLSRPDCILSVQDNSGNSPLHIACNALNDPIIRHLKDSERIELDVRNKEQKTPSELLTHKSKQAGQFSRFQDLIGEMETGSSADNTAARQDPQDQPNLLKIQDADENGGSTSPSPGRVNLDSFDIIEPLGKGSFGTVFLVTKKGEVPQKYYAMKILEKDKVLSQNLVRYAKTERNVLSLAHHQFIVGLNFAFQSQSRLYLIMDYAPGGDMGMALANQRRFQVEVARVYAAEIVLALEYLHKQNIIFRDLKPDNVVFDGEGHAMLTDFGLSKTGVGSQDMSQSFCGSVAYLAPEMLRRSGHSRTIDWYLLGVLIYEMLVGVPPYFNTSKTKLFENIQQGPLKIPHTMPHDARQIILLLLNRNPQKRLGAQNDAQEVKQHEFFACIDWDAISNRTGVVLPPTIRPIKHDSKSMKQFLLQEKESQDRFADFASTNLRGPQAQSRANVDNWSFVRSADQPGGGAAF